MPKEEEGRSIVGATGICACALKKEVYFMKYNYNVRQ
jgi:hypothetical protein